MPQVGKISETSVYDPITGEEGKKVTTASYNIPSEPPYIKLYIADILYLQDLPRRYEALTLALLKRVSFAGADQGLCVSVNRFTKETICKEIDYKNVQSIDNALKTLVNGKILYRLARGVYRFNPYLFGRGDWADVKKIRLEVNYDDIRGKTVKANMDYYDSENKYWNDINKDNGEEE